MIGETEWHLPRQHGLHCRAHKELSFWLNTVAFWSSMSASTMINSTPLSMINPQTPNNISTITAATPHQSNAPSLTPSPLEGVASVTTLVTSTLTLPTSLEPSPTGSTQSLSSKNSYSMASPRTPITCLSSPPTILAFTVSNGFLGKVSTSSPRIPQPRTSLPNPSVT